jgi:Flp pilus assembly protein TadD
MKPRIVALWLTCALGVLAVHAADTPDPAPAPARPAAAADASAQLANARTAIEAKDFSRALRELRAAERIEPRNADVHNLLGFSYRQQSRPDLEAALRHYQTALQIAPNHRGAHEYIGEAYLLAGNLVQAEHHLGRLREVCGAAGCKEATDLAQSIERYKARGGR